MKFSIEIRGARNRGKDCRRIIVCEIVALGRNVCNKMGHLQIDTANVFQAQLATLLKTLCRLIISGQLECHQYLGYL